MSTTDKLTFTLACDCGALQSACIYDKGFACGGSHSTKSAPFSDFEFVWL